MSTCSTCKHWKQPADPDSDPEEGDDVAFRDRYGTCTVASSKGGMPTAGLLAPAYAVDSSGYHAALATLPSFGCIQHEDKD